AARGLVHRLELEADDACHEVGGRGDLLRRGPAGDQALHLRDDLAHRGRGDVVGYGRGNLEGPRPAPVREARPDAVRESVTLAEVQVQAARERAPEERVPDRQGE